MSKQFAGLAFLAVALLSTTAAIAQEAGIEQVTVTAQRRSEILSRVPVSVSAFTADRMETLNVKNFADIARFTPGVTFDDHSANISIRGVNSDAGSATTGIYIDDTPIQLRTLGFGSDNTLPAVFDLERVEVLRGPQGTLFGAGSEGGAVRYITPQPDFSTYSGFGKTEVSFTESGAPSYEMGAAVGGPIVEEKLAFRVSAWYRHDGGYIDHVNYLTGKTFEENSNFTDTFAVHGAVAWRAGENLIITPSIFYQNRRVHNDDEFWVALSDRSDSRYINETPELMGDHDHFSLPALKIDWTPGNIEIVSNTSYFDRHQTVADYSGTLYNLSYFQQSESTGVLPIDYTTPCQGGLCLTDPQPLLLEGAINLPGFGFYKSRNIITNTQKNFTEEVRAQSADPDSRLQWTVGIFYTHQDQLSIEEINNPQAPQLTEYLWGDPVDGACFDPPAGDAMLDVWCEGLLPNGDDYINHTNGHEWQLAGFVNATYAILPDLKVQLGARYARTHFDFSNFSDGAQNFGPLTGNSGKQDERPFTPMGNVTWQINDDDMVYATVAKGYRIGGANPPFPASACTELDFAPSSFNSDSVISYEIGSKDRFFGGRVQVAGSVYFLKWKDIQQSNYLSSCGFKYTTNLGTAESKGFDLEGQILVTDELDVDFALGYTDAHFTSTSVAAGLLLARNGDKLPGSPWTFSIGAQYTTQVMGHDAFLRMDYQFASRETGHTPSRDPFVDPVFGNTTSFDPALLPQPETNIFSLRGGMTFDRIAVNVFADNLFNSQPQLNYGHQDSDTLLFEAETLRPRTIGISATYRY